MRKIRNKTKGIYIKITKNKKAKTVTKQNKIYICKNFENKKQKTVTAPRHQKSVSTYVFDTAGRRNRYDSHCRIRR